MGGEGPRLMDGAVSQGCARESVTVLAAVSCPDLCVAHLDGRGADWGGREGGLQGQNVGLPLVGSVEQRSGPEFWGQTETRSKP